MNLATTEISKPHFQLDTLGGRIRAVLKARNITVTDAAGFADVSRTSLNNWMNGTTGEPKLEGVRKFCAAADISLEWLMSGKGDKPDFLAGKNDWKSDKKDWHSGEEDKPIPEVTGSMSAHAKELNREALRHWMIPANVLNLSFNSEPEHCVVQRVVASDQTAERGDYLLIDTSRIKFDDAGCYLVTNGDAETAFRIELEWTGGKLTPRYDQATNAEWQRLTVLGRVMAVVRPT